MKTNAQKGFTLTEVIAVAVIVAIISLIGIPILTGYMADAQIDSARNKLELIGTAIMHAHTRGQDIGANSWADLGITDPGSDMWAFTFGALAASADEVTVNNYSISVTGQKGTFDGETGTYSPNKSEIERWTGVVALSN